MPDVILDNRYRAMGAVINQTEKMISGPKTIKENGGCMSFREILDRQLDPAISFSKHASQRAMERNISVTDGDLHKLGDACQQAAEKGIKDALIMMNDSAFIVNAPGKVVITVVDKREMKSNVITNIDGAVFL